MMITMLLGALWHGASWNFVISGGYHGALPSAEASWV
jgi:alginate O-acetyltransferase complex protein AlgI